MHDFQVLQADDGPVEVRVLTGDGSVPSETSRQRVAVALEDLLGAPGATRVSHVDHIPVTRAGKLRHVVSGREAASAPARTP
jgi:hypothetical protein